MQDWAATIAGPRPGSPSKRFNQFQKMFEDLKPFPVPHADQAIEEPLSRRRKPVQVPHTVRSSTDVMRGDRQITIASDETENDDYSPLLVA